MIYLSFLFFVIFLFVSATVYLLYYTGISFLALVVSFYFLHLYIEEFKKRKKLKLESEVKRTFLSQLGCKVESNGFREKYIKNHTKYDDILKIKEEVIKSLGSKDIDLVLNGFYVITNNYTIILNNSDYKKIDNTFLNDKITYHTSENCDALKKSKTIHINSGIICFDSKKRFICCETCFKQDLAKEKRLEIESDTKLFFLNKLGCNVTTSGIKDNSVKKKVSASDIIKHKSDIVKKVGVEKSTKIIRDIYVVSKNDYIYVTNATKTALRQGNSSRKLIYHTNENCELAHRDYVVDNVVVALNSGVICVQADERLVCCDKCEKEISDAFEKEISDARYTPTQSYTPTYTSTYESCSWTTCPRCDGTGYLPHFDHVEGGVCFKCGGSGEI